MRKERVSIVNRQVFAAIAFFLLCNCGCNKTRTTDELISDLRSSQERDRLIAVRLLAQRNAEADHVIPALVEAIKDPANDVRLSAVIGLGSFGDRAHEAVPALQEAIRNEPDGRVRRAINQALTRIAPAQFSETLKK